MEISVRWKKTWKKALLNALQQESAPKEMFEGAINNKF